MLFASSGPTFGGGDGSGTGVAAVSADGGAISDGGATVGGGNGSGTGVDAVSADGGAGSASPRADSGMFSVGCASGCENTISNA